MADRRTSFVSSRAGLLIERDGINPDEPPASRDSFSRSCSGAATGAFRRCVEGPPEASPIVRGTEIRRLLRRRRAPAVASGRAAHRACRLQPVHRHIHTPAQLGDDREAEADPVAVGASGAAGTARTARSKASADRPAPSSSTSRSMEASWPRATVTMTRPGEAAYFTAFSTRFRNTIASSSRWPVTAARAGRFQRDLHVALVGRWHQFGDDGLCELDQIDAAPGAPREIDRL